MARMKNKEEPSKQSDQISNQKLGYKLYFTDI